ncbi:MAG: hypothetical protein AAGD43_07975 [Pseudomonadota bacterium]
MDTKRIVERDVRLRLSTDPRFKSESHDQIVDYACRANFPVKLGNTRINPWHIDRRKVDTFLDEIARQCPRLLRDDRNTVADPLQSAETKLREVNSSQ